MVVSKSVAPTGYTKVSERDPFAPAISPETFALIHAALYNPWDQLVIPPPPGSAGAVGLVGTGSGSVKGSTTHSPVLPEHTPLYSARSVATMASWISANMPVRAPLKGMLFNYYLIADA